MEEKFVVTPSIILNELNNFCTGVYFEHSTVVKIKKLGQSENSNLTFVRTLKIS